MLDGIEATKAIRKFEDEKFPVSMPTPEVSILSSSDEASGPAMGATSARRRAWHSDKPRVGIIAVTASV